MFSAWSALAVRGSRSISRVFNLFKTIKRNNTPFRVVHKPPVMFMLPLRLIELEEIAYIIPSGKLFSVPCLFSPGRRYDQSAASASDLDLIDASADSTGSL